MDAIEEIKAIALVKMQNIKLEKLPRNTRSKKETQVWIEFTGRLRGLGFSEAIIDSEWVDVRSKIV